MRPRSQAGGIRVQSMSAVEVPPVREHASTEEPEEPCPVQERPDWRGRCRLAVSFPVVLTLVVLTVEFAVAHGRITDPDIWWHLHNAEHLVRHHSLPRYDMYSFTVSGHPWINHEWLAELPYYFGWRALGLRGIDSVTLAVLSLIFLGVLYLSYRESGNYKASVVASCYAILISKVSFGPRTILFGYAYLVLLLIILQRFRHKGRASLWLIPLLFCLWVNTHGSWLIGLIIFSIVVAAGLVSGRWRAVIAEAWTPAQRNKLLLTWGAAVAVLFVNPFGARLVFYPFDLAFRQQLNIEHVSEWVSVSFHDPLGKLVVMLVFALLVSALLRPSRWTLAELGLVLFALYSGLTYVRFLFLLGIVVAPNLAKILDFLPPYRPQMDTPVINTFAIALMIGGIVYFWPREAQLQGSISEQLPVQAFSYLQAHPPSGPMLNEYFWGGYLNWRDPSLKIFVDSRVDIFEYAGVLKDYLDLLALDHPETILDKYNIRYVLLRPSEHLMYVLLHDPRWRVLYSDKISVLLERIGDTSSGKAANLKNTLGATGGLPLAPAAAL